MMMKRILPLVLLLWAATAVAENPVPDAGAGGSLARIEEIQALPAIGLEDLFRLAELAGPDLVAARLEVEAGEARLRQAGLLPNPELTLAVGELFLDTPEVHKRKVELSQALAIGGRRGSETAAADADLQRAREDLATVRRESLRRIHHWWVQQLYLRAAEQAYTGMMAEAEKTLEIARIRFEARAVPEAHLTRATLELFALESALADLDSDRARSRAAMPSLLGGHTIATEKLAGDLESATRGLDLPRLTDNPMEDHPALRAARHGVTGAEASLSAARRARVPDLNLFVAYGRARPDEGGFVEGGISLPLPLFDRNQGNVAETASRVELARQEQRAVARDLQAELAESRAAYRAARLKLDRLAGDIAPAARRSLDQAREGYRTGHLMFLELVDAQRTFNDVNLQVMELRRELARIEADLMSLLGAGPYSDERDEQ